MNRPGRPMLVLLGVAAALVVVVAVAGAWWVGTRQALGGLAIQDVTADAAAQAMKDDRFYADYGQRVLVIHGTVASVKQGRTGTDIVLRTEGATRVTCVVPSDASPPGAGEEVRLVAVGASAVRGPDAVVLPDCRVLTTS